VLASRLVFARAVDQEIFKRRVLVYGAGAAAAALANLRRSADRRGFLLVASCARRARTRRFPPGGCSIQPATCASCASGSMSARWWWPWMIAGAAFRSASLLECRLAGVDVTELLSFLERETGRVRIDVLNPSWMIFGQGFRRDPLRLFTSRTMDLLASLAVLALSLPIMLLTWIAIKIEDGWRAPALYARAEWVSPGAPSRC